MMLSDAAKESLTNHLLSARRTVADKVDTYLLRVSVGDDGTHIQEELERRHGEIIKKALGFGGFGELTKDGVLARVLAPYVAAIANKLAEDLGKKPLTAALMRELKSGMDDGLARGVRDIGYRCGQQLAARYEEQLQSEVFGVYDSAVQAEEQMLKQK